MLCNWPDSCPTCADLDKCRREVSSQTEPCADPENCAECPDCIAQVCNVRCSQPHPAECAPKGAALLATLLSTVSPFRYHYDDDFRPMWQPESEH